MSNLLTGIFGGSTEQPKDSTLYIMPSRGKLMAETLRKTESMPSTEIIISPITAQSAALALRGRNGPKNGGDFVTAVSANFVNYNNEDIFILFYSCKKYSLKKEDFDRVMLNSLDASKANLTKLGVDIESSRPRQVYTSRGSELKVVLQKFFWDKLTNKNALSWGNIARIPVIEEFCAEVHGLNKTFKPAIASAFYSNMFWMNADFQFAKEVVIRRLLIIHSLVVRVMKNVKLDDRGNVKSSDYPFSALTINPDMQNVDIYTEGIDMFKGWIKERNALELLDAAVMVDPRKLLQSRTVRQTRNDPLRQGEHKQMVAETAYLMKIMIMAGGVLLAKPVDTTLDTSKLKLNSTSEYTQAYYAAYGVLHTFVRSLKRSLFGTKGGPDTRSSDFEGIETPKEAKNLSAIFDFTFVEPVKTTSSVGPSTTTIKAKK